MRDGEKERCVGVGFYCFPLSSRGCLLVCCPFSGGRVETDRESKKAFILEE